MEYALIANPQSPGYAYLAIGSDVPALALRAHGQKEPVVLGQAAADDITAWLAKYWRWPASRWPLQLTPIDRSF